MTKEMRGFINRIRKAQDRIYASKPLEGLNLWLDLEVSDGTIFISAFLQGKESPYNVAKTSKLYIFNHTTAEVIEEGLKELSEVIGFTI